MSKKAIATEKAPGAIGPYSQAIKVGNMIFTSGQIPIDPATGNMVEGIKEQTRMSLTNIKNILETAGCGILEGYGFLRRDERSLCRILQNSIPCTFGSCCKRDP